MQSQSTKAQYIQLLFTIHNKVATSSSSSHTAVIIVVASLLSLSCCRHLAVAFAMCMALLATSSCWCHCRVVVAASSTLLLVMLVSLSSPRHPRCCAYTGAGVIVVVLAWTLCRCCCGHVAHAGRCHMVMAVSSMLLLGVATCVCAGAGLLPLLPLLSTQVVVVVVTSHGHLCTLSLRACVRVCSWYCG